MNKTRMLIVGIGQAGNILCDALLQKDKRYTGLFINSAYEDMSGLSSFNYEKNAFTFPGESGTGRNREKAKVFVKDSVKSLGDTFLRYPLQDVVVVMFSTDGGTGSGSSIRIIQALKSFCPNKKINVIAVLPDPETSDDISLNNCLQCCKELSEIEDLIDDIKFIDNSKGKTYEEVNDRAIDDINASFSINGRNPIGNIDDSDSKRVNTEKGYGLVLRLKDKEESVSTAIDNAIKNTVFAIPDSYDCNYLGISVKADQYDVDELKNQFEASKTTYKTYNNNFNLLVLGGCSAPNESIEYIRLQLDELKEKNSAKGKKKKLSVGVDTDTTQVKKLAKDKEQEQKLKTTYSENELDKLVDDLENLFG
jgi:hypothetical protein